MDVFTKAKRSTVMAAIRSRGNERTEERFARILRRYHLKGWRRHQRLPGRPDFVFRTERVVVFIDGCFWHCCPTHGRRPDSNRAYWLPKLDRNKKRDLRISRELRSSGWKVLRVWEHDLRDEERVLQRIRAALTA